MSLQTGKHTAFAEPVTCKQLWGTLLRIPQNMSPGKETVATLSKSLSLVIRFRIYE